MEVIADLQLHSKFSRAVSKEMTIPNIALWARRKGIELVATGDWTHPLWFREIERDLEELGNGLLRLKRAEVANENFGATPVSLANKSLSHNSSPSRSQNGATQNFVGSPHALNPLFLLATEVSSIYKQGDKVRRVHTLLWVPSLDSARKISQEMTKRGCNLMSDGRPIIGLTSIQVAELVLSIEPKALIIPAHAWTPWFSVYGALGGFDSIEEAFGEFSKNIYAVETGLSSSPSMNWRIRELDNRSILSFSDAHSGPKLGREATVFEIPDRKIKDGKTVRHEFSYNDIYEAIKNAQSTTHNPQPKIAYTLEFYPEEGKYHYTGHRACNVRQTPSETKRNGTTCPVCGKPLTVGVMHRVEDLAVRSEAELQLSAVSFQLSDNTKIDMIGSKKFPERPPFVMLVPLQEIIAEAVGSPVQSPKVQTPYFRLTDALGDEFTVLLKSSSDEISKVAGDRVAAGIEKVRNGDIVIDPGYDGVFGVVKIWREGEDKPLVDSSKEQLSIF